MISQADLKVISTVFGKTTEEVSSAISQENEVSLDLRLNGRVISQEDEKALKDTIRNAGIEIGFKQLAKELNIELSSEDKEAKVIAEKLKTIVTTSLEGKYKNPQPGEKEKELEEKLKVEQLKYDKLLQTHESTKKDIDEWQNKYQTKVNEVTKKDRNNSVLKLLPEKIKQDRNDALIIFNNTFEFDEVDGIEVIKRNGQVVTDAVGKPEILENIVPSFAEEKKWLRGYGMNGDDRPPINGSSKGGKTPEEAHKYISEKLGADKVASQEGLKLFKELTAKAVE